MMCGIMHVSTVSCSVRSCTVLFHKLNFHSPSFGSLELTLNSGAILLWCICVGIVAILYSAICTGLCFVVLCAKYEICNCKQSSNLFPHFFLLFLCFVF